MASSVRLIENKKLLDAVNFAVSQESNSDFIGDAITLAIQFVWAGATAAAGDLEILASNDNETFVTIDSYSISGETSGSRLVNIERAGFCYVKAKWTRSSGSGGTLTVTLASKGN